MCGKNALKSIDSDGSIPTHSRHYTSLKATRNGAGNIKVRRPVKSNTRSEMKYGNMEWIEDDCEDDYSVTGSGLVSCIRRSTRV